MQADSIRVQTQDTTQTLIQDTTVQDAPFESVVQSDTQQIEKLTPPVQTRIIRQQTVTSNAPPVQTIIEKPTLDSVETEQNIQETFVPFSLFENLVHKDSSVYKAKYSNPVIPNQTGLITELAPVLRETKKSTDKGWVFGVAIISTLLLIVVRIYFQKYLSTIITSVVNLQIADKLIREKNILVRRVFTILNINFLISASLYIYIIIKRIGFENSQLSDFYLYLFVFALLFLILFVRLIIMNIVAGLFDSRALFREFIHNTYLLNKNLGLILLPLVLSMFYLSDIYVNTVFYITTILVIISFIYRYLRSLQIILKHKVLYFYTILYLCTLEILPALVGIKFVLSLR